MEVADYTATNFVNGSSPGVSAGELNKLGDGIALNRDYIQQLETNKVQLIKETITISLGDWSGTTAPYSVSKTISGLLSTDTIIINPDLSGAGTFEDEMDILSNMASIYKWENTTNTLTLYANNQLDGNLSLKVLILR